MVLSCTSFAVIGILFYLEDGFTALCAAPFYTPCSSGSQVLTSAADQLGLQAAAVRLLAQVPAASERPLGGCGSGDATEPETPLAGDEELGDDDDDEARATAGFRALPLVAKDPRDPRDPNSPRKYGLGKSRRPKKGAPASTAGGALSTRDVDVDGVQSSTKVSTFEGSTPP